jgi:hypothetical protein
MKQEEKENGGGDTLERLQKLIQAHLLAWSGHKLGSAAPARGRVQGSKTVAELLLEERR